MSGSASILVIEDDVPIRRGVVDALTFAGYDVNEAGDGNIGLSKALETQPDLVLLDVLLPKRNGFDVLAGIRSAKPTLPVIMLTARGSEEDRIRGLRSGADDYVVKPFSARELLARVEAVLRRSPGRPLDVDLISLDGICISLSRRQATLPDASIATLTDREAAILRYLASNRSRAVDRLELLHNVWGLDPRGLQTRTVDMHIARLREKLGDDPANPRLICTVRAKGYMLGESATCEPPT